MEDITKELNSATQYLRVMKRTGNHKEDCDNVLMHLANIEDLVNKLFIANVSQHRKLLLAYHRYLTEELSLDLREIWIDEHLKANNCG